ncbi:hypothetical protein [Pseudodesulfovibrio senegalensis]|uniref:Uncharacterized protein n=1 Tax=Pseudodesulfovibrio senegalensis TaxID=1721087 RepID=A0A6N6MZ72_9BACT|nr:hypothetical protein [Pseudodesulfovibrio senegalensis]KAB1437327.1 hypothetical protein F8A88_15485 [Pseudodesulfovibrio senegalensis]
MYHYETQEMTGTQAARFMSIVDREVGTDRERTDHGNGVYSVSVFELEQEEEINICRRAECLAMKHI